MPTQANYCGHLYNFPGFGLHVLRTGGPTKGQIVPLTTVDLWDAIHDGAKITKPHHINAATLKVGRPLTHPDGSPVTFPIANDGTVSLDELAHLVEHYYTVEWPAKIAAVAVQLEAQ